MAEAYRVGTEVTLTSNVVSVLEALGREMRGFGRLTTETQGHVERLESSLRAMGESGKGLREAQQAMRGLNRAGGGGGGGSAAGRMESEARAGERAIVAAARVQERMDRDHMRALQANDEFDRRARQQQFDRAYQLANIENRDIESRGRAQAKFDQDHFAAVQEDAKRTRQANEQRFDRDYAQGHHENQARDARAAAEERAKPTFRNEFHDSGADMQVVGSSLEQVGEFFTHVTEGFIHARGKFDQEMAVITNTQVRNPDGTTREMNKEERAGLDSATSEAVRVNPAASVIAATEVLNDLRSVFGDLGESKKHLNTAVGVVSGLQLLDVNQGGSGDLKQALALFKFIEDNGGAKNPDGTYNDDRFDWISKKVLSIAVETRKQAKPSDFLALQKSGKEGLMNQNDHATYGMTPFFMASLGASRFGTAVFRDFQVMLAGKMDEKREKMFEDANLITRGAGKKVKDKVGKGSHFEYDPHALVGYDVLQTDMYKYIHDILAPGLAKRFGVDQNTAAGKAEMNVLLTRFAQQGTMAGAWSGINTNYGTALNSEKNIDLQGEDFVAHMLKESMEAQQKALSDSWTNFQVKAGKPLMQPVIDIMHDLSDALRYLTAAIPDHEVATARVIKTMAAAGLASTAIGVGMVAGYPLYAGAKLVRKTGRVIRGKLFPGAAAGEGAAAEGAAEFAGAGAEAKATAAAEAELANFGKSVVTVGANAAKAESGIAAVEAAAATAVEGGVLFAFASGVGAIGLAVSAAAGIAAGIGYIYHDLRSGNAWKQPGVLGPNMDIEGFTYGEPEPSRPASTGAGSSAVGGGGGSAAAAAGGGQTTMTGVLNIDGAKMGTFAAKTAAAGVMAPQSGLSGPNIRLSSQPSGLSLPGI